MTFSWGNNLTNKELTFPKFNYTVKKHRQAKGKKILASEIDEQSTDGDICLSLLLVTYFMGSSAFDHRHHSSKVSKLCWCCPPSLSSQSGTLCWTANSLLYLLPPHYYRRSGSDVTFLCLKKTIAGEYSVSYIYYGQSGNIWYLIHAIHIVTLLVPGGLVILVCFQNVLFSVIFTLVSSR